MPESLLRQRLFEQYISHWERLHGPTVINPRDSARLPAHHLRTWDRTYGHLVRDLPDGSEVLDLGCGTGLLLYWLRRYRNIRPVGVDVSAGMVEVARSALPDIEIHCGDGLAFLRSNHSRFSGIFCFHVLEHVPEEVLLEFVEACAQALRPGGFLCCETPNAANSIVCGYLRYDDLTHLRSFTAHSLTQLFEAATLRDCRVVPLRPGRLIGRVRHTIEHYLHKALFLLANCTSEQVFSASVAVVGYRPSA